MAKKKTNPAPDEERELDKAYWELTGYKFNRKKSPWFLWLLLGMAAGGAALYFDLPALIQTWLG